jgi:hypothetical protein
MRETVLLHHPSGRTLEQFMRAALLVRRANLAFRCRIDHNLTVPASEHPAAIGTFQQEPSIGER